MKLTAKLSASVMMVAAMLTLCGCIVGSIVAERAKQAQETYCIAQLPVPYSNSLNSRLYDVSHEYGVGIYIVNDLDPGVATSTNNVLYTDDNYARQVHNVYNWMDYYDDYVMLAIGNNVLSTGTGMKPFVDIEVSEGLRTVITDEICAKLICNITDALNSARTAVKGEPSSASISSEQYADILYGYVDELTSYLGK